MNKKIAEIKKPLNKLAHNVHEIYPLIRSRWSPRVFDDKKLEESQINSLFEAARWAPSSNNLQPWRFIYAQKGDEGYDKLFESMGEFNQSWAGNAPMLMVGIFKKKTPDGKDNFHALYDLGSATANFSIQAESMEIAVHQMAGFDFKKVAKKFDIPDDYHPAVMSAVGFYGGDASKLPDDLAKAEKKERERKPMDSIVGHGKFVAGEEKK